MSATVFLVTRYIAKHPDPGIGCVSDFIGVFDTEEGARRACTTWWDGFTPFTLNEALSDERTAGEYVYPLTQAVYELAGMEMPPPKPFEFKQNEELGIGPFDFDIEGWREAIERDPSARQELRDWLMSSVV